MLQRACGARVLGGACLTPSVGQASTTSVFRTMAGKPPQKKKPRTRQGQSPTKPKNFTPIADFDEGSNGAAGDEETHSIAPSKEEEEALSSKTGELINAAFDRVPVVQVEDAAKLHELSRAVFIDVREPPEWAETGYISNCFPVPRGVIEFVLVDKLKPDVPIVLYCSNGTRAALAGSALMDLGYTEVMNGGSLSILEEAGVPVEPFNPGPPPGWAERG